MAAVRTSPVSIRIPQDVQAAITTIVKRTGRDFSSVANEMLAEAVKMRRIPGIVFADGPTGRRARIAGTGLEVFEIIDQYLAVEKSWEGLQQCFDWLNERQLRAALAYYEAYPEEIDERLAREEALTEEAIYAAYPFMKPPVMKPPGR
jgi:uncharacterized protein (DUF433 family)